MFVFCSKKIGFVKGGVEFFMMSSSNNLVTTIIGFGLSATFIVFVCTRLICGRFRERHVGSRTIYEMESRPDIERVKISTLTYFSFLLFILTMS